MRLFLLFQRSDNGVVASVKQRQHDGRKKGHQLIFPLRNSEAQRGVRIFRGGARYWKYRSCGEGHQISASLVACRYALTRRTTVVVTDILPLAETKPAILTDRDGFLAYGVTFEAIHNGRSLCELMNRTVQNQERPPIKHQLTQLHQFG